MNPAYRSHRTPVMKIDHPTLSHRNPGHLQNPFRKENAEMARDRKYTPWEPPAGAVERYGKKIVVPKKDLLGVQHVELD